MRSRCPVPDTSLSPNAHEASLTSSSPAANSDGTPVDITVVMPVRNEAAHIEAVLGEVLSQELGALTLEVLVVDGESTDNTVERVKRVATRDSRVRVLNNPKRLSSAARALGVEHSRGTYVAIIDGHCHLPSRTLLADMVDLFERTGADCLSRPQPLVPSQDGMTARAVAAARTSPFGHSVHSTIYDNSERKVAPTSSGAMYHRRTFEKVGNFDTRFDACEDVEFNYRCEQAGLDCYTSPALAVEYEPRSSFRALYKQMHRYGLGRARLHRKHRSAFQIESLIPLGFVLGIPIAVAMAWFLPSPWRWLGVAPYALYALLSLVASIHTASKRGWALLPLLPVAFFVTHTGLGMGYLKGWITTYPAATDSRDA